MLNQSDFLSINGTKIKYQMYGEGFPIVFIHAGIADSSMWDDQIPALSKNYRVITYDMRGYGLSPHVPGEYRHSEDLIALLETLAIDRCILVGCSKGGSVAIDATLSISTQIAGLIVVSGVAQGLKLKNEPDPPPQWSDASAAFKQKELAKANELEIQMWVDGYNQPVGRAKKKIREKVRKMNAIALDNEVNSPDAFEKPMDPIAADRLSEISIPTIFISGALDDPYITQSIEHMLTIIPQAKHHQISNAAHLPNMETPEEFNALVINNIKNISHE